MCLKIGDTDQCVVLRHAPAYNDRSLESWQHSIEENHVPPNPALWEAIAQACGFPLSEYQRQAAILRGENAVRQLKREIKGRIEDVGRYGSYFSFPPVCGQWVQGEIHEYPDAETMWLSPDTSQEVRIILSTMRFNWFWRRILHRDLSLPFAQYPERISWTLQVWADTKRRADFEKFLKLFERTNPNALDIPPCVRLTFAEIQTLVAIQVGEFLTSHWQPNRTIMGALFTTDEMERFDTFERRRVNLYRPRLKVTRETKTRRNKFYGEFRRWSGQMLTKYGDTFQNRLRQHLIEHNLASDPEPVPLAA
jgi:hypothetical protein